MNWTPLNLTVRAGCYLAYETTTNPSQVSVDDPIDKSKRLDGTETLRFS